jgi:hypothetical protein
MMAQNKYKTTKAIVNFDVSVPFFKDIKAVSKSGTIMLDPKTSALVCVLVMKDFVFPMDIMKRQFNDNYIESKKYPRAVFKGKIINFDINEVEKEYQIAGKITLHGKSKEIIVNSFLKKVKGGIEIVADFTIMIADFDIEIPFNLENRIAKTVNIKIIANLHSEKKTKKS